MSDQALVNAITAVLEASTDGLNEREIRQAVLKAIGLQRRPPEILAALRENPDVFIGPLADGRWRLRTVVETEESITKEIDLKEVRQERGEPVHPFIATLPALDAFISFWEGIDVPARLRFLAKPLPQ